MNNQDDDEILELADEIPYAKVNTFTLQEVEPRGGKFLIHIKKKCEGIP